MTGQFADQVEWRGEPFGVTAVDGSGLFEAAGAQPTSTACYRGYIASYRVDDGRLVLAELETGPAYDGAHLGVPPVEGRRGVQVYRGLAVPVAFTGRLLIGGGYVDIGRLHMGFRPAYGFQRVWELAFDAGRLTTAQERSAELAAVRERLATTRPGPADGEPTRDWVERTFSLSFAYSWPRVAEDR
ncbi:hypothetical protein ABZS66_11300 [Dactylosporangium sp. NPDC005572]|uniref:hypothetical protein n=1 Tax=Dactylosporangium sp. NPDC005572 TaxID=3156889 RepID=UPI0033A9D615